jgi:hypothetical protein
MPITFKSPLSSQIANETWLDKTIDDAKKGKFSLYKNAITDSDAIDDVQDYINEVASNNGQVGEGDPNAKTYSSEEIIANGDDRKVAIGKLDAQAKINLDTNDAQNITIADHEARIGTNEVQLTDHEARIGTNETEIQAIEDSVGSANGICPLDATTKIDISYIPDAVLGTMQYQSAWNADTNTPTITSGVGTKGHYYVVNVSGTTNLDGEADWQNGDWAVFNGTTWEKIDNSDKVSSVNGQVGVVVLDKTDIGLSNVTDDAQLKRSANDFSTFTEKVIPVEDDIVLIEDSEDSGNKKKVKLENLLGGGGGGGGSTAWIDGDIAPYSGFINGMETKDFDYVSGHEMFLNVIVPESYSPGKQIKLLNSKFFCDNASNNVSFKCETTLIKTGEDATASVNSHLSTNAENTLSTANTLVDVGVIDLTDLTGQINSVAVAIGDLLIVKLFRDYANETISAQEDARMLKYSASVSFEG